MIEFLNWLGLALAGLMGVAVTIATWEHLRHQTLVEPHLHAALLASAGRAQELDVDLPLGALASDGTGAAAGAGAAEPPASRVLMSQTLNRASSQARHGREASPWLDTQPRVSLGDVESAHEAQAMMSLDLRAETLQPAVPQAQAEPAERAALR